MQQLNIACPTRLQPACCTLESTCAALPGQWWTPTSTTRRSDGSVATLHASMAITRGAKRAPLSLPSHALCNVLHRAARQETSGAVVLLAQCLHAQQRT